MILQFKVKNFLSIREEQTLDFTASADKTYEDYAVVKIKGVRISKLGVVYGPNASGKSNILKALAWFIFYLVASRSKRFIRKNCTSIPITAVRSFMSVLGMRTRAILRFLSDHC